MSQFIAFLPPPGVALANYNSAELHTSQPAGVPEVFRDAMSVRQEVFVEEQHVPQENEYDLDDPRSFHWVAYASVGISSEQRAAAAAATDTAESGRKGSTANKLAIGTIRLVPPPHPPHPEASSHHAIDNHENVPEEDSEDSVHKQVHDGKEPYIKLGRLAVLPPFRGLGLSRLLIDAALSWVAQNQQAIIPPLSPATAEQRKLELGHVPDDTVFRGLVLVHAQKTVEKVWSKHGFVRDEKMGVWFEEGIEHVGMWKRIDFEPEPRRKSVVA